MFFVVYSKFGFKHHLLKDYHYPSEMLLHLCQKSVPIFVCLLLESLLCSFNLLVHFENYKEQF